MIVIRAAGFLLLVLALVVLGLDLIDWQAHGIFAPTPLAALWGAVSRSSFEQARDMIGGYATHTLWEDALAPALALWAAPSLAALGLAFLWMGDRGKTV